MVIEYESHVKTLKSPLWNRFLVKNSQFRILEPWKRHWMAFIFFLRIETRYRKSDYSFGIGMPSPTWWFNFIRIGQDLANPRRFAQMEIFVKKHKFFWNRQCQLQTPISRKRCVVDPPKCYRVFDYKTHEFSFSVGLNPLRWCMCERQLETWKGNFDKNWLWRYRNLTLLSKFIKIWKCTIKR